LSNCNGSENAYHRWDVLTLETEETDGKEPLGQHIIETPENAEATEVLRDDHSGFIVYAPVGCLKLGQTL
jgi:hypothetical protein